MDAEPHPAPVRPLAAFSVPNYRRFVVGQSISLVRDVGAVPFAMGHYVENTGDETLTFLEMFRSDHYADVCLSQWMGVLPPELVKAHLNLDDDVIAGLPRTKAIAVG